MRVVRRWAALRDYALGADIFAVIAHQLEGGAALCLACRNVTIFSETSYRRAATVEAA